MKDLINDLINDEGFKTDVYIDTKGKQTIGVGHNLTDNGLTSTQVMMILQDDIQDAIDNLKSHLDIYSLLDDTRQEVLVNMCFNLGIKNLLSFKRMIYALEIGDYITASKEMLHSKWAGQVGARAMRLSKIMMEGKR